ncbi:hypothetical protein D9M69_723780 [compost metagenome]
MVLQGTGHDLAGRSRAFVDDHHQGHALQGAFGVVGQALDGVVAAAAQVVLRNGLVDELAVFKLAVGGDHGHVFRQEGGRQGHGGIEQTTWVVAQVQHQAL